jgi:hypothetical protein
MLPRFYYRSQETAHGKSRPTPAAMRNLASRQKALFPSGVAAAYLLGFTTQVPKQDEVATSALSVPRKRLGEGVLINTRRPVAGPRPSAFDTDTSHGLWGR